MIDTSAITLWLAIIAVASLVQVAMIAGAALGALIIYRRTTLAIELLRQEQLQPLVQRLNTVLDDLHDVAGRVKSADDQMRDVVSRTADRVGHATALVGAALAGGKFLPLLGVLRGVWAVIGSVRNRFGGRQPRVASRPRPSRLA